jgi:uncharacterized protein
MTQPYNTQRTIPSRNLALDLIRGVAVLGMIFINILVFVPDVNDIIWQDSIVGQPTLEGSLYKLTYILFNGKMRAMFALLFGAGIILFFQSNANSSIPKSDYFGRRMLFLLVFGLIHAYLLLWPGSILFEYAICGLLLFSLRGLKATILTTLSIFVLGFYTYLNSKDYTVSYHTYKGYEKALQLESNNEPVQAELLEQKEKFEHYLENFLPFSEAKKQELEAKKQAAISVYTSDFKGIYTQNLTTSTEALSFGVYLNILESIGTMLLGMALFKIGFFEHKLKRLSYTLLILVGIPLGLFAYDLLYHWQGHTKDEVLEMYAWKFFSSYSVEAPARILLSLGYCALLVALCGLPFLKPILRLVANVGRMAFSNYVIQTLLCVILFYGLQYYGKLNMVATTLFAIGTILFQLLLSYCCIHYFNSGPMEYLWRKLSKKNLPASETPTN